MVQTKALIPGRTVFNTVLQAAGFITQRMQRRELVIRNRGMFCQGMRLPGNRNDLLTVDRERQQCSRAPDTDKGHQRPGNRLFPRHTDPAATNTDAVIHDALPGYWQAQGVAL